jgi:PAS domain-containing protein
MLWLESRGRTSFEERAGGRHPVVLRGALLDISERKRAEEHLRRAAALDAFRLALADALRPVGDSTAIKNQASRVVREHLGAARVVYCDISDDEVAEVTGGDWAPAAVRNSERFELCHWGTLTDRLRAGRTIHSDNVRNAPDLSEAEKAAYAALSSGAWAFTPLVKDSRLVATVAVQFTEPHAWTPDELGLIEETAGRIWAAVERARAEQALRESEARFRALVTATSYVVYRMSPDWEEMRQLDGRGFIADTWSPNKTWLGKYIHPDDQPHVMEVIRQAIRTKGVFELEHRVLRVDGTLGWTLSRAVPLLNSAGEITEWFGAASDVTARKQAEEALRESEEKYRTLFNTMSERIARSPGERADNGAARE